jgi:catechol 2,3-dioxygenase-like lactoylglutathione lyase family enzyme
VLHAFDHAVIAVRDLAAATRSTAALYGREPSWQGVHPSAGSANALFRLENCYVELLARDGDGPVGALVDAALAARGEGVLALAFGADDVAGCVAQLRGRGVEAADPSPGEGRDSSRDAVRRWSSVVLPVSATRGLPLLVLEHHSPPSSLPVVEPTGPPEAAVAALDHAVVLSGDPALSGAFYHETLGLRLALDREFPKRGIRILFLRVGGVTVEVAGPSPPAAGGAAEPDRFGGLAYCVANAARARERLLAADFDVSEVRDGHKPGTQVCTVRSGTCGVPTLLVEPAPRG